jgi:hypothetical protein
MKDVERDLFKILALGLTGVVLIKLAQNAGGVSQIVAALGGAYTGTIGALAKA